MVGMKDVGLSYARNAGADLSEKCFYWAKVDSDGDIILATAGAAALGVIIEADVENSPVTVMFGGIVKAIVGASPIAAGATVGPGSGGTTVAVTSGAAGCSGIALEAGDTDAIISIALTAG